MPARQTRSAGPSVALIAAVVVSAVAGVWVALFAAPGILGQVVYGLSKAALLAIPLAWLLGPGGRRFRFMGMPPRSGWSLGVATGGLLGGGLVGGYYAFGDRVLDRERILATAEEAGFDDPLVFALLAGYLILVNPALEEFSWRWFVQSRLYDLVRSRPALAVCAALFTVHHVFVLAAQVGVVATVIGSAAVFAVGLLWSWLYWEYESLWPGYVSHALVDVALVIVAADLVFR